MVERCRLDDLLVARGIVPNKSQARALIMEGKILVGSKAVDKPGTSVPIDANVELKGELSPYVSRGGFKLAGALDHFTGIQVQNAIALDIGASTGGFTDCLLQRGAQKVYAVDVGYGQLAWKLRSDPRVINHERTNFRYLEKGFFPEPIELAVGDLSFISLEKIMGPLRAHLHPDANCVMLIKPQFEVGKGQVGSGGVVRDAKIRQAAINRVIETARSLGYLFIDGIDSSLPGAKSGNVEYLAWFKINHEKLSEDFENKFKMDED